MPFRRIPIGRNVLLDFFNLTCPFIFLFCYIVCDKCPSLVLTCLERVFEINL